MRFAPRGACRIPSLPVRGLPRFALSLSLGGPWFLRGATLLAAFMITPAAARAELAVQDLRCEYLDNPQGIDAPTPRLSWIATSAQRGERQTAYQILVASTPENLAAEGGDLWDTGRVAAADSIQIPYSGKPLTTYAQCFWKVRTWDNDGKPSAWSKPARWSMGMLSADDWKAAQWIGAPADSQTVPAPLAGAHWIWYAEGNPAESAPVGTRYFRRSFELPAGRKLTHATLRISADNRCEVFLNGTKIGDHNAFKSAGEFSVDKALHDGVNVLAVSATNEGAAPNPAAIAARLQIDFDGGDAVKIVTDEKWTTTNGQTEGWFAAKFDDATWLAAKDIGPVGMAPWGEVQSGNGDQRLPARYVRKEFSLDKQIARATVSLSGLGVSELYLNGVKVSDAVLSPAVSEYPKRVYYVTYDVTKQLQRGVNAMGVLLGNGRYFSPRNDGRLPNWGFPKLLLKLNVQHADGSTTTIVSDGSWKASTDGPIVANNEYDGEEYNANKNFGQQRSWTTYDFDDASWKQAEPAVVPTGQIRAQMIDPIRVTKTLKPIAVTEVRPGVFVFDMGQNLVGWCRIRVPSKFGASVKLVHAETLKPDGNLYLANLRAAKVTDVYTQAAGYEGPIEGLAGGDTWEPRFTYHGFRYVEVTGWPGKPTLDDIEGRVVHDDLRSAGDFACSSDLLNKIYQSVCWGVRGNYRSMPTDCPQRDERQGWMGDRGAESRGEMYIFDNAALYAKWLHDMEDAQKVSGSVPDVCPAHWPIYSDNVTWPSTTVIVPGSLYRQFGDLEAVRTHYDSAKRWVDYMLTFVKDGVTERDTYGDWCVPPEDPKLIHSKDPARQTSKKLLATSYLYNDLRLMEQYAKLLGKTDDAARFAKQADDMKAAFNKSLLNAETGQYDNGSQTSCVLPLAFGLVPDDLRSRVFDRLVKKISDETNNHIGTGLIGGQFLCGVLSDGGRSDLMTTIATQTDYPSWGYMIEHGATTIWELWNGNTADPAMNSGNHVMLVGDLVIWFYEYLAGIRPDDAEPGFKHIVMRPEFVPALQWVKASHNSPYGLIESAWQNKAGALAWQITVPVGSHATVYVPAKDAGAVTESGGAASAASGVKFLRAEDGRAVFDVEAGKYEFVSRF